MEVTSTGEFAFHLLLLVTDLASTCTYTCSQTEGQNNQAPVIVTVWREWVESEVQWYDADVPQQSAGTLLVFIYDFQALRRYLQFDGSFQISKWYISYSDKVLNRNIFRVIQSNI